MGRAGRPNKIAENVSNTLLKIKDSFEPSLCSEIEKIGVNSRDEYGRTPLIIACFHKNFELVKWLINKGADINAQDRNGYSALHASVSTLQTEIVKYLIKQNIEIDLRDVYGNNALWTAVMIPKNNLVLAEVILEAGANPDNINKAGRSPRQMVQTIHALEIKDNKVIRKDTE